MKLTVDFIDSMTEPMFRGPGSNSVILRCSEELYDFLISHPRRMHAGVFQTPYGNLQLHLDKKLEGGNFKIGE